MDFESLLKDAYKEEGAGQYVLFDDYEQFLGQYQGTRPELAHAC
ncbi:hypothetical protein FACS189443_5500 [Planctomycetales bacterium]|nr:hypothetical protein FACS189443_5500 [Planctomycetales bacterium]